MRQLSHQWTDKKPFTRRVRWYAAGLGTLEERGTNIKLVFVDQMGEAVRYYGNQVERANADLERFKSGQVDTIALLQAGGYGQSAP